MPIEGYMSVRDAMRELGVNRARIHQLIQAGILRAEKIGNSYAITRESVIRRKYENPGSGRPKERKD